MNDATKRQTINHHHNPGPGNPLAVAAPAKTPRRAQIDRNALLRWSELAFHDAEALATLLVIAAHASERNELVISRADLAWLVETSENVVDAAVQRLVAQHWITVSPIDQDGSVSEYNVNAQVVWTTRNDNRGSAKFSKPSVMSTQELRPQVRVEAESRNVVRVFGVPAAESHRPSALQPHQAIRARARFSMTVRRAAKALWSTPAM